MTLVLGLDIGGANTKYVVLEQIKDKVTLLLAESEFFPLWKKLEQLPVYLLELKEKIEEKYGAIDYTTLVTTAELADCFQTKKEGIAAICAIVEKVFGKEDFIPLIYNVAGTFLPVTKAEEKWLEVSATNWVASANYLAKKNQNAIILDIGSTTTDIIPIFNSKIVAKGKNDFERLANLELVYSGTLRTNVARILLQVKLRNEIIALSSELFATSGDVYLLLDMITSKEFSVETADGRASTKEMAAARLARTVCADMNQLTIAEVLQIAKQVKEKQFEILSLALNSILQTYHEKYRLNPKIILIGSGSEAIGISLLRENGIYDEVLITELISKQASIAFPAFAIANLLVDNLIEGNNSQV